MRVIGIDPSLTSTAIAEVIDGELVAVKNIKTKGKKGASVADTLNRITHIVDEFVEFVFSSDEPIGLVVIEGPSFGSKFGSPHERGGLWWALVHAVAVRTNTPVIQVAPTTRAKYGSGAGNSPKDVVWSHAIERYTTRTVRIANDDIADAVILAAMGSRALGMPVEEYLPASNLAAMDAVVWPV